MTLFSLGLCSQLYQLKAENITRFFGKTLWVVLLTNMFLAGGVVTAAVQHPNTLIKAEELTAIKAKVAGGVQPWKSAYDKMISQANFALNLPDMSVTFGGKNNCGSNNIFCTGAFYNGEADRYDWEEGAKPIGIGVRDLGMAYAFTGDARYADKLIRLVRVWALDAETRMRPEFGNSQGRMDIYGTMTGLIYGVDLAWNYSGWNQADKDTFKAWVQTLGNNAKAFSPDPNNFENWRNALLSVTGAFTGDQELLDAAFQNFRNAIPGQVHWSGRMNQEYGRTNGWGGLGYSMYAIHAMTMTAEVARQHNIDLYNYFTEDSGGKKIGLKTALDFHVPYVMDPGSWKWGVNPSGQTINAASGVGIYELAYSVWQDPAYLGVVNRWGRPMGMNMWALGVVTLTHANRFDQVLVPSAPSIMAQPSPVTLKEGEDASFSVVASGSGPLTYQWLRDGGVIVGATSAGYTVTEAVSLDNGSVYSCEISNSEGNVLSDGVVLTVLSDSVAPTLVSAFAFSDSRVDIVFNEPVSANSAEDIDNYQIDLGIVVTAANLSGDGHTVSLTVSKLIVDTTYTVLISNVQDVAQSPNTIVAQSSQNFTYRTADGFEDGTADGWSSLVTSNWSVVMDEGDMAYYLNTTNISSPDGERLGEYSLLSADYGDFGFAVRAKLGDDVSSNAFADYAIVFGYQDLDNYYYMLFNNDQNATQLFKVVNSSRVALATASSDWLNDNEYHNIVVNRTGGDISVHFDGNLILSTNDSSLGVGKIGVGSFNDSAYFDDVSVTDTGTGGGDPIGGDPIGGDPIGGGSVSDGESDDVAGGGAFSPVVGLLLLLLGFRRARRSRSLLVDKTAAI